MPNRKRRIAVVAHCHLNVNTKVHGLADYAGVRADVVAPLVEQGIGIVQLPCPEATYLGMARWGMTREQYDTGAYRAHCRRLLGGVVETLVALAADGCEIVGIFGVDGSPSCGVDFTCFGYTGGSLERLPSAPAERVGPGKGVFFEELAAMLATRGIEAPTMGVSERLQ